MNNSKSFDENEVLKIPELFKIDNESDFKIKRPDGFFDVVKAIYLFGSLTKLDVNLLLENLGLNRLTSFTIIGLAKNLGYIYEKNEKYYVNNINSKITTDNDSSMFKLYLKFASLIGCKYSKANYPSTICFVTKLQSGALVNIELVDGRYDAKSILYHLETREKRNMITRYFMLINNMEEAAELSLSKDVLFPSVKVKCYILTEKNKGYTLNEVNLN